MEKITPIIKKSKITREAAEAAVRTLIQWAGDDPNREGLLQTPERVVKSFEEFYSGYGQDPEEILARTFEETAGYDEMITLKAIPFESQCEHHMLPVIGHVHIGYIPNNRVVGISKLARVVDVYAKRLQIQEKMTSEIAQAINKVLQPKGVGVIVEASHQCMTTRGVHKRDVTMQTSTMLGAFKKNEKTRSEFLKLIKG